MIVFDECVTRRIETPRPLHRANAVKAFRLERRIPHGERLVDDQQIGRHMHGDRECQADDHAARVGLDRLVDEVADRRECIDRTERSFICARETPRIAPFRKTFSRPVNSGLKPLPSSSNAAMRPCDRDGAGRWRQRTGDKLKKRRFAGAVASNDADCLTPCHPERHAGQRPELAVEGSTAAKHRLQQPVMRTLVDFVALADVLDGHRAISSHRAHKTSAKPFRVP